MNINDPCFRHDKEIIRMYEYYSKIRCRHPYCLKFNPLCEDCLIEHNQLHDDKQLPIDCIQSVEECIQETRLVLDKIKEDLERTQNRAATELTTQVPSNIDEVLVEVESIRHQINRLFDRFIQSLKDKFESKIKSRIFAVYDEIKGNIDTVKEFQKQVSLIKILKLMAQNDMEYQALYQKSHLENLITQRANQKFEGRIDDDVALHFIGVIQKELENLVVYEPTSKNVMIGSRIHKPKQGLKQDIQSNDAKQMTKSLQQQKNPRGAKDFQSFATVQLDAASMLEPAKESHSIHKHQLFFFEPNTKMFHYLDVVKNKSNAQFTSIELGIEFKFTKGARSIYAEDGKIYYICGYEEGKYTENEEERLKTVYQLDYERRTMKPIARLITLRNNFSVCCTTDQDIYIIGGENYKEGCLPKCEKVNIKNGQVTIINHLMEPSAYHTCSLYNNQYIFKIGGCRVKLNDQLQMCQVLISLYNIERDVWSAIDFPRDVQLPTYSLLSFAIQVNDSSIFVFGGIDENKTIREAYLLNIEEEEEFDNKDTIRKSLGFFFKLNYQPLKTPGFSLTAPLLITSLNQTQIYAHMYHDLECKVNSVWVFDKKWKQL